MDAELIVDEPIVEDELDITNDEHELKTLDHVLVDLQNIYQEIQAKGGVNKTIAVAIESIKPGLLSEQTPVNSFTADTSKTNLQITVEGIISGIAATIKFIMKTISNIIGKIIDYIRKLFHRFKAKQKFNQEVVRKSKVLANEIYDLKTRLSAKDHLIYQNVFTETAAEANAELGSMHNDLFKELVLGNKLRSTMLAVGGDFFKYVDGVNSKFTILEKVAGNAKNTETDEANNLLSDVDKYIKNGNADGVLRSLLTPHGNGTIASDLTLLKDYVWHLEESKTSNQLNYQNLFDSVRMDKVVLTDVFVLDLSYAEKNLEMLKSKTDKLDRRLDTITASFNVQAHLKDALVIVKEEINSLLMYAATCGKVSNINTAASDFIYTMINRHYKRLLSEARKSDDVVSQNAAKESFYKTKQ